MLSFNQIDDEANKVETSVQAVVIASLDFRSREDVSGNMFK